MLINIFILIEVKNNIIIDFSLSIFFIMVIVIVVVVVLNILKNKQEMNLILLIDDGKTRIENEILFCFFCFGFKTPKQN